MMKEKRERVERREKNVHAKHARKPGRRRGARRHARRRYVGILIFLGGLETGLDVIPLTNGCLLPDASWQTGAIVLAPRGFRTKQADEEGKMRNISPSAEGNRDLLDRIQAVSPRFVAETNCSFFLVVVSPRPRDNCIGRARRLRECRGKIRGTIAFMVGTTYVLGLWLWNVIPVKFEFGRQIPPIE